MESVYNLESIGSETTTIDKLDSEASGTYNDLARYTAYIKSQAASAWEGYAISRPDLNSKLFGDDASFTKVTPTATGAAVSYTVSGYEYNANNFNGTTAIELYAQLEAYKTALEDLAK